MIFLSEGRDHFSSADRTRLSRESKIAMCRIHEADLGRIGKIVGFRCPRPDGGGAAQDIVGEDAAGHRHVAAARNAFLRAQHRVVVGLDVGGRGVQLQCVV